MSLLASDFELDRSDNHPDDNVSTAGGDKTTTKIDNSAIGEWFTRLRAPLTGDIYTNEVSEYQKAFLFNKSSVDDLLDAAVFILNGIADPGGVPGLIGFQSLGTGDDSTKKIWCYGESTLSATAVDKEAVILNNTTLVNGGKSWVKVFRCKLVYTATGLIAPAANDILIYRNGVLVGMIPQGMSFATSELKLWLPNTTWESGAHETSSTTNRITPPSGSTFTLATNSASAISIRSNPGDDTLAHGQAQPIWGKYTVQPGMESYNGIPIRLRALGSST